jgi:2-dehydropantoate 2-reductase
VLKVLVLGAGALGGYYGSRLIQAGADVTFLVRPARAEHLQSAGLSVKSTLGSFDAKVKTLLAGQTSETFDVVLLACKAYDLADAMTSIAPHIGPGTGIIPLLNGYGAYESLDSRFGREHVLGGVSYIATTLAEDGKIVHLNDADKLVIGARHDGQRELAESLFSVFQQSKGIRTLSTDIEQDLWEKWVMLATGAAVTCLMRASISQIMATTDGKAIVERALEECTAVATQAGRRPREQAAAATRGLLFDPKSPWKASMQRDIERGLKRIEADAIVGDMLQRAVRGGTKHDVLTLAYCHLQAYSAAAGD